MQHGLHARWNGVTGHTLSPPDYGQVIPEGMQRAKHLALRGIMNATRDLEEGRDTLDEESRATGSEEL